MKITEAIKQNLKPDYAWAKQAEQKLGNFFRALHCVYPSSEDMKSWVHPKQEMDELIERLTNEDARIFQKVYNKYPFTRISKLVNGLNL